MPNDVDRIAWWRALRARGPAEPTMRLVLFALSTWMAPDGSSCFPSQKEIAMAACVTEKTAQRILKRAERAGWLRGWLVAVPNSRKHSKHYRATDPASPDSDSVQDQPRSPEVLIPRAAKGRFNGSTPPRRPINPSAGDRSTPLGSGGIEPWREPLPHQQDCSPRIGDPGHSDLDASIRDRALALASQGMAAPAIAGIMFRHEIPERLISQWISESRHDPN